MPRIENFEHYFESREEHLVMVQNRIGSYLHRRAYLRSSIDRMQRAYL